MVVRRSLLVLFVLAGPVLFVAAMDWATLFLLYATRRSIDPGVMHLAAGVEYAAFLFLALLEAKNRW